MPVIQLALSGKRLSEQQLFDIANNFLRTQLATVQGAAIPYPYGGKQPQIQVDLDPQALQSKGLSPNDVVNAITAQNLIVPGGTSKIGTFEYDVDMNASPKTVEQLNDLPIKIVAACLTAIMILVFLGSWRSTIIIAVSMVRLSAHAELAVDYFVLRGIDNERQLLDSAVEAYGEALGLTTNRFAGGLASGADVAQAETQLETTRAQATELGVQRAAVEHAIACSPASRPRRSRSRPIRSTWRRRPCPPAFGREALGNRNRTGMRAQPRARLAILRARCGNQGPERLRMVHPPQVHQLVNQHVVTHPLRHRHEPPVQADVPVR